MIAEDVLERGLADLASEYDVPVDGPDRIAALLTPSVAEVEAVDRRWWLHRPSPRGWLVLAAASLVIVVIASFAIGGGGSGNNHNTVVNAGRFDSAGGASGGTGAATSGGTSKQRALRPAHLPAAIAAPAPVGGATSGSTGSGFSSFDGVTAGGATTGSSTTVPPVPSSPSKVIKTGELDLQVKNGQVGHTLDLITGLATRENGYIASSRTSEGGFAPSGEVTLRVPVASFDDTVSRARTLAGVKVLGLDTSGKDVTSKYVDLKARISALEKTRATFLTLLSRATTIGETLAVQQHITDVQTEIEQLQGQKKVLVNQAALSTLTVTVDQKQVVTRATPAHHKSGLHKAVDRSVSRFVHGIEAIIGIIGPLLLAALLIALFWFAGLFGYRALRRRMV
jgi:hypothetical protein